MKSILIKYFAIMLFTVAFFSIMIYIPETSRLSAEATWLILMAITLLVIFNINNIANGIKMSKFKKYTNEENVPVEFENVYQNTHNNCKNVLAGRKKKIKLRKSILCILGIIILILTIIFAEEILKVVDNKLMAYVIIAVMFGLIIYSKKGERRIPSFI